MADVFDINSASGYSAQMKPPSNNYNNHRGGGVEANSSDNNSGSGSGWIAVETNTNVSRKDPRLAKRDDGRKRYSPNHGNSQQQQQHSERERERDGWVTPQTSQMYGQPPPVQPPSQTYQPQPPPPPMYTDFNNAYGQSYQHGYSQQAYQPAPNAGNFAQYSTSNVYPSQPQTSGYNNSMALHSGVEYPGAWIPTAYPPMGHPPQPPQSSADLHSTSSIVTTTTTTASHATTDTKIDDLKKEAVAQELKQQRATLVKQRDEYLRKANVLRRELDKLRNQKHELLSENSPSRDSQRILRENAKLQLEIQNKLKSINNVVDMLSGIIGDGLRTEVGDNEDKKSSADTGSGDDSDSGDKTNEYNYVHYDPELHWCRVCDVFPRTAKDYLNHLHSAEHRHVMHEHQLGDTPWHKLPPDPELPSHKGAPVKRVPIKGLQFFISATAWYCKLCDVWIGDLHCASLHLKSKNHSHNYSNFIEQNKHWESNWFKDREKAFVRCSKSKHDGDIPPAPEPPTINKKSDRNKKQQHSPMLDISKNKKKKKRSKRRKKIESSGSSSSSSSSDSSSEDESDKSKSIRVSMRNKMRMQAQMILNEEIGGKLEALGRLVEQRDWKNNKTEETKASESNTEDNIINQWMTVKPENENKQIVDNLKGRLKSRQEAEKEKALEAAAEQRKREREREERELKELREREQRELEEKMREDQEREREGKDKLKDRERNRRRRRSDSRSPELPARYSRRSRTRSRSRSRSPNRLNRRRYGRSRSPDRFKSKRDYDDKRRGYRPSGSRKLPFIGRMPLFKKRPDMEEKEIKREDYEVRLSKFEPGNSARAFIPEPGIVHIMKLATPQELKINAENPPPPPQIIPEPPQISETPPSPPQIHDVATVVEESAIEIQDMDLDEAAPPLPPGVPVAEAKPLAKPAGNYLPRDFQDALNIIYPTDQNPAVAEAQTNQNVIMQQYQQYYGMMYPGMYDYSGGGTLTEAIPEPPGEIVEQPTEEKDEEQKTAAPVLDEKEDLAMLGIDAEDMAAQTI